METQNTQVSESKGWECGMDYKSTLVNQKNNTCTGKCHYADIFEYKCCYYHGE